MTGFAQRKFIKTMPPFWKEGEKNLLTSLCERGYLLEIDLKFSDLFGELEPSSKLLLAYLFSASRQGHLCVKVSRGLFPRLTDVWVNEKEVLEEKEALELEQSIQLGLESLPKDFFEKSEWVLRDGDLLYLQRNQVYEREVFEAFLKKESELPEIEISVDQLSETLLEGQREAIEKSLTCALSFITGGPGVGKTYTASHLLRAFIEKAPEAFVGIFAPTGKAVANLEGAFQGFMDEFSKVHLDVFTLHKLFSQKIHSFLPYDLMLIDESSMIDLGFMRKILLYAKPGSRLIFLGDPNQLPPIESGFIFHDLIQITKNKSHLSVCQRVEAQELIQAASDINEGNAEAFIDFIEKNGHYFEINPKDKTLFFEKIISLFPSSVENMSPPEILKAFNTSKLLTPVRAGPFGVDTLNHELHEYFAHLGAEPILITANDYRMELFNGDVGVKLGNRVALFFPRHDRVSHYNKECGVREIPLSLLPQYESAYAVSVHKSQGSEYNHVAIILPPGSEVFGKELLYTAVTRAKKRFDIFGDLHTLRKIISSSAVRYSGFQFRRDS